MTDTPPYLWPFVLDVSADPTVGDGIDWYFPDDDPGPWPAAVFVHGGPVREGMPTTPRHWPVYRGYGALCAQAGLVGVVFDHRFHGFDRFADALADIARVVAAARAHPKVDGDRIAIWGFSNGGLLLGEYLDGPEPWLRAVAASYPLCGLPDAPEGTPVSMVDAVAAAGDLPLLLVRVGLEDDDLAEIVVEFVAAAERASANLDIIDVPNGSHGFDLADYTDESRDAVRAAMAWVGERLRR